MRQLLLNIGTDVVPTFDNFVCGRNLELQLRLVQMASPNTVMEIAPESRFLYLWGEAGVGKSHLLSATAAACGYTGETARLTFTEQRRVYVIDDCDKLSPEDQIGAFGLFNQIREHGGCLITSGSRPPAELTGVVREDLRTRLGWGLVYQLHGLNDDEKIAALTHIAQARHLKISEGVLPYLIRHYRRDMHFLSHMLDALDLYSLETQRPITLPLLHAFLQQR